MTPLLTYEVSDAPALNEMLVAEIGARRGKEGGVARSNRGGWHSKSDFFKRTEPGHKRLAGAIREAVKAATLGVQPDAKIAALRMETEGWINVNPPGALNAPHDHPAWLWSGSYYAAMPDPPPARTSELPGTDGCIEFLDGRTNLKAVGNVDLPFLRDKVTIRPRAGLLLLFPSFVTHWVYPSPPGADRISIAFNARFVSPR